MRTIALTTMLMLLASSALVAETWRGDFETRDFDPFKVTLNEEDVVVPR